MYKKSIFAVALAGTLAGGQVFATNGYLAHGYGPVSKSMAGACVAMVETAMCGATNPATMAFLDDRWETGAALFAPDRGFDANNDYDPDDHMHGHVPPRHYTSKNKLFLIPHFAYNKKLDGSSNLGVILGGNGGMNTEYDSAIWSPFSDLLRGMFQAYGMTPNPAYDATSPTGIDLTQLFLGVSYGRKLTDRQSVSIMPILAVQAFEAQGLEPFRYFSVNENAVTNNGHDYSWGGGARLGWFWKATDELNLAASYQTRLYMSRFEDYEGLFAEAGDFDIPPVLDLGLAYSFHPDWTLSFNYQYIWYSEIKSIGNRNDVQFTPNSLGSDDGPGFGWDNQAVYKFGLRWKFSPDLTLRAGYSHANQVVPDSQGLFNVLAPAVVTDHYTLGLSKKLTDNNEMHVSFMYAPEAKVYGTNPNTGTQTGDIYMSQWEIELGWVFKL